MVLEEQWRLFQNATLLHLARFRDIALSGGFAIVEVRLTEQSLLEPLGRPAVAQTLIRGNEFHIVLRDGMNEEELSISLYDEVLEAATVAAENRPESVMEFSEGDLEESARFAHARYGTASPASLNEMLEEFGFQD
jgi:hypothetical protein